MSAPTVADLVSKAKQGKPIKEHAEALTKEIDQLINRHEVRFGRNDIQADLPVTTTIHGLDRADAQRFIYSHLIATYTARGFDARVEIRRQTAILHLFFDVSFDPVLEGRLNSTITSHRVGEGSPGGETLLRRLRSGEEPLLTKGAGAGAAGGAGRGGRTKKGGDSVAGGSAS